MKSVRKRCVIFFQLYFIIHRKNITKRIIFELTWYMSKSNTRFLHDPFIFHIFNVEDIRRRYFRTTKNNIAFTVKRNVSYYKSIFYGNS